MQKITKLSVILLLVVFMTACGGGGPKAKILGKWSFISVDGKTDLPKAFKSASLDFSKDGNVNMYDGKKTDKASWEFDKEGKTLTLKSSGNEMKFTEFSFKDKNKIEFNWNKKMTVMEKK